MSVRYRVLGPVEIRSAGRPVALTGQPLTLVAALLVRVNTVQSIDALAEVLWPDGIGAPANPRGTIQTYVTRLRRALGPDVVQTAGSGYGVSVDADGFDLLRFQALAEQGDQEAAAGHDAAAVARFDEALALWRGPALQDVRSEVLHRDDVPALDEQRLSVWERWADGQLRQGEMPVEQLQRLTRENPLRERFWEQRMLVLYRAGRQADALAAYRQVSAVLADELGLDPGPALQQLQQRILVADPDLQAVPQRTAQTPRQLSAVTDGFVGRSEELARLAKVLGENVNTIVIDGPGGVGKTTVALRFAHEVADRFPDGQVQLNLHGYGPGDPVEPAAALGTLLQSVGVPSDQVPATADERSALWRTHTAGRAMLVLLDNARNSEQARPLLPGPGCLVIVTSRSQLSGLVARDGAAPVPVGRLSEGDARALLATTVGAERADPAVATRFVEMCARLPLAIRILGQHANQQPERPLSELLDEISSDGLASFDLDDGADTNLRDIFAHSYAALDGDAARLFRLLGLHPGPTFGAPAAAALAGLPVRDTRRLLGRLVGANLLERPSPGRYEFHDLLREFAVEQTGPDDEPALVRVLDWYVYAALRASHALRPGWADAVPEPAELELPDFAEHSDGLSWFAEELANLQAAFDSAGRRRLHWHVCQLALALRPYFNDLPLRDGWISTHEAALNAAGELGDRRIEGRLLNGLGLAHSRFGEADTAFEYCTAALTIAQELGLDDDEFAALNNLNIAAQRRGDEELSLSFGLQALRVAERVGQPRLRALARNNLCSAYLDMGRFDDVLRYAGEALDIVNRSPLGPHATAFAQLNIAHAQFGLGRYADALATFEAALEPARAAGTRLAQAEILDLMGDVHVELGNVGRARQCYREALDLLALIGHRDAERVRSKLADLG